jgi:hypothetical protein
MTPNVELQKYRELLPGIFDDPLQARVVDYHMKTMCPVCLATGRHSRLGTRTSEPDGNGNKWVLARCRTCGFKRQILKSPPVVKTHPQPCAPKARKKRLKP